MKKQQLTEHHQQEKEWLEKQIQLEADAAPAGLVQEDRMRSSTGEKSDFTDAKQYPEDPFSYRVSGQEHVQLNSGTFQYDVTDFVLPGRDGFDLKMVRRYDSGCANIKDMSPYQMWNGQIMTGSRDNSHNNQLYGLGYGWSFVLPSIEAVPYMYAVNGQMVSDTYHNYVLHLEDGRVLRIADSFNQFRNYYLKDVQIRREKGNITHPYHTKVSREYNTVVEYKDGRRDYFTIAAYETYEEYIDTKFIYTLVARQDRFGNVICFHFGQEGKLYGGMTIVDTWGREVKLEKTENSDKSPGAAWNYQLKWSLPKGAEGQVCEIKYQVKTWSFSAYGKIHTTPYQLVTVIDPANRKTSYEYHDPSRWQNSMQYAGKGYLGFTVVESMRSYLLLKTIFHPNQVKTEFEYGYGPTLLNKGGGLSIRLDRDGYIKHYPLYARKEVLTVDDAGNEQEYHKEEYRYSLSANHKYIEIASATRHGDVVERCTFDENGLLVGKEVRHGGDLIASNAYTYGKKDELYRKRLLSAVETICHRKQPGQTMKKETSWRYDPEGKANVIKVTETYENDPSGNQTIETQYGDYNLITEVKRKKGSEQNPVFIREINMPHPGKEGMKKKVVVQWKQIYEGEVLKEKIEYQYNDPGNQYCVTGEKHYLRGGGQDLNDSGLYTETIYQYNSEKYTHAYVSREIKGIKDADGQSDRSVKETIDYDQWGRIVSKTNPNNQKTTISYDVLGRVVMETLPKADGQSCLKETFYNDELNYLVRTDADRHKQIIRYTPLGQVKSVWLAASDQPSSDDILLREYEYNPWGELIKVLTYDGNGAEVGQVKKTEQYVYDSLGRVQTCEIPEVGYQEVYQYEEAFSDPADPLKKQYYLREQKTIKGDQHAPDVVTTVYKDQKGQIRKELIAGECVATYQYDNAGNQITLTDAQNKVERREYDYAGRVLKTIRMADHQEQIIRTEYDELGNKRFVFDESGKKTQFQYDGAGRLTKTIAPLDGTRSRTVKYYYDPAGNVIWEKKESPAPDDQGGQSWQEVRYVYDERNRLTGTYQYLSGRSDWIRTRYRYDVLGNVIEMRTGDTPLADGRQIIRYTYDRFGNVLTTTDARGSTEYCQYDRVGVLQMKTDRNGNKTVYQYDALGRLVKEAVNGRTADGAVTSQREYGYGKTGQIIRSISRQTEPDRVAVLLETRYYYDGKGQLIRQTDPGNAEKSYTYDRCGNRQSFRLLRAGQQAADISLYYCYDDLYRLKQVRKDSVGGTVLAEYEYDVKGNRKTLRYPQIGLETSYRYNDANQVISLENKKSGAIVSAWEYAYDVNGNLRSKADKSISPAVTTTYCYDRIGRLTEEDIPGWKKTVYEYDAYSNRIRMIVAGREKGETYHVTTYQYNLNNWLEKETRKQGKTTEIYQYRYDDHGNETFRIWEKTSPAPGVPGKVTLSGVRGKDPTVYEWRQYDGFHQLIRIIQDDGEISYQYRGDGLRHSREVKELTKSRAQTDVFYWDGVNIVGEQTDGGSVSCYLRGINLIARQKNGMLYYYLFDAHGDVTQLWNQNGGRVSSYKYDAFGNAKELREEDENPFRYCGEYYSIENGTYYLRNRYYNPSNGRFTQEDPIRDGLNWYTYCDNNPVMFTDPWGLEKIVLTGSEYTSKDRYKYNFVEPSIKQIKDFLATKDGESITWIISSTGYSTRDINLFKDLASVYMGYGINLVFINSADELYNYLNSKDIGASGLSDNRVNDPVTAFSVFSHGLKGNVSLGYNQGDATSRLEMTIDGIQSIDSRAFSNTVSFFGSCNTGTGMENSFAQAWVNITRGSAQAVVGGTTTYVGINTGESILNKLHRRLNGFNPAGSRHYPVPSQGVQWHIFTRP